MNNEPLSDGLQCCLDKFQAYCNTWHLNINTSKTKIVVFNKTGRLDNTTKFTINDSNIEIVKEMKYLGTVLNNNCSFRSTTENLKGKAMKALFKLYRSFGNTPPTVQISKHLFDAMIRPILTYNSEIWGSTTLRHEKLLEENTDRLKEYFQTSFEKLHIKWCKYTLGVHSKSSNIAVLSELGRYPITLHIIQSMVKYWYRLTRETDTSLILHSYKENIAMLNDNRDCWLKTKRDIMFKLDLGHIYNNPDKYRFPYIKKTLTKKLTSIIDKQFTADLYNDERHNGDGNKLRTFRIFKNVIEEEPYLSLIKNMNIRKSLTKLRISAHNLPIEVGRHRRNRKTPLAERICDMCNSGEVGDEFHLVMMCNKFKDTRELLLKNLVDIFPTLETSDKTAQFVFLMRCYDMDVARELITFIKEIIRIRGNL